MRSWSFLGRTAIFRTHGNNLFLAWHINNPFWLIWNLETKSLFKLPTILSQFLGLTTIKNNHWIRNKLMIRNNYLQFSLKSFSDQMLLNWLSLPEPFTGCFRELYIVSIKLEFTLRFNALIAKWSLGDTKAAELCDDNLPQSIVQAGRTQRPWLVASLKTLGFHYFRECWVHFPFLFLWYLKCSQTAVTKIVFIQNHIGKLYFNLSKIVWEAIGICMELNATIVKFPFTEHTFSNESKFFWYKLFYPLAV